MNFFYCIMSEFALFLSSDVLGFLKYTDKAIFLENGDIAILENKKYTIFDTNSKIATA